MAGLVNYGIYAADMVAHTLLGQPLAHCEQSHTCHTWPEHSFVFVQNESCQNDRSKQAGRQAGDSETARQSLPIITQSNVTNPGTYALCAVAFPPCRAVRNGKTMHLSSLSGKMRVLLLCPSAQSGSSLLNRCVPQTTCTLH